MRKVATNLRLWPLLVPGSVETRVDRVDWVGQPSDASR